MAKRLNELLPGEKATVVGIEKESMYRKRLMEIGFRKDSEVIMRRDAPLGDPMEVYIMGYNLSLRRSEAGYVIINKIEKE